MIKYITWLGAVVCVLAIFGKWMQDDVIESPSFNETTELIKDGFEQAEQVSQYAECVFSGRSDECI